MSLTPEQIALRRTGIAASEVAAVAGLHPHVKPIKVWAEKVGLSAPFEGNEFTKAGESLEPYIADFMYRQEHADEKIKLTTKLNKNDPHGTMARNVSDRFTLFATPDRFVWHPRAPGPHRIVQAKNVGLRQADRWGEEGTDTAPEEYVTQCAAELAVVGPRTGIDHDDLVVLIGGQSYREYPQHRDLELEGQLIEICEKFWVDHVMPWIERGEYFPPPVDGSQSYSAYLKHRFPRDERPMLSVTEETTRWMSQLRSAKENEELAATARLEAENALKSIIGDSGGIEGLVSWKQNRPSSVIDWEGAAHEMFEDMRTSLQYFHTVISKHTTTKPGARVFRLIKPKEK